MGGCAISDCKNRAEKVGIIRLELFPKINWWLKSSFAIVAQKPASEIGKRLRLQGNMSSASVTSSKREKVTTELMQELDSVRTLNNSLRTYLEHIRTFKRNLKNVHENCKELNKVNLQWIDILNTMKKHS